MASGLSKRQFIKCSLLGVCGLAAGFSGLRAAGRAMAGMQGFPAGGDDGLWKWSIEARHYINTPRGIKCKLCPHACNLKEGETGDCRTRTVKNNKLYSIAYGNPCAVHIDPIEKKPLYHFLPGSTSYSIATAGCNLACLNCQNWNISQLSPLDARNYDLMPESVVNECIKAGCASIFYTYSEPIAFYEYTFDTARIARQEGIKNIFISAGYINPLPLKEITRHLDAANIDLKSFDNDIYEMLNAGTLEPVLNSLKILRDEGVWLEITNLVVPTWTDDMDMIRKMCHWLAAGGFSHFPLHFSRFHPMYKLRNLPATPYETLKKARAIARSEGMDHVYIGNVPGGDAENTICPQCGATAIERKGYRIIQNNLSKGSCGNCGNSVAGVWN